MFFGLTLVGFAVVALFVRMKWANTVYIITGYRLIIRTGVFNRAIRIVPVSAVNEITINTGTVDRFLGLNKVRFTTAASGAGLPLLSIWFPNDGAVVFSHVNSKEVMKAFTRATT